MVDLVPARGLTLDGYASTGRSAVHHEPHRHSIVGILTVIAGEVLSTKFGSKAEKHASGGRAVCPRLSKPVMGRAFGGSLALGQEASSAAQARRADRADAQPIRMGATVRNGGSGVIVPVLPARAARSGWLSAAFWLRSTATRPEAVHRFRM